MVLALLAAVAVLVVAVQAPGWSHASLRASSPSDGESLASAPDRVSFTFNEEVQATTGALRVFDGAGARVDDGVQVQPAPDRVEVGLGDLADGGYVATFRVTSADGHVIRGAITFRVGAGAALDDDTVAALFGGGSGPVPIVATVVRGIDLGATLVAVGALLAALGAATTVRQRRLATQTAEIAAWTAVVATILTVPLQAMETSGLGLGVFGSMSVMGDAVTSSVGIAAFTRLAGLALVVATVVTLERPPERRPVPPAAGLVGGAVLALGSLALDGHTRTVEPAWVMLVGDLVHVGAAAVWAGGLVVLARVLTGRDRRTDMREPSDRSGDGGVVPVAGGSGPVAPVGTDGDPDTTSPVEQDPLHDHAAATPDEQVDTAAENARFLATFSSRALWAMLVVAVAGSAMSWALVRQPRALVTTDYGWILVAKVTVVGLIVLVAAYNRFRLVPAVTAAGAEEAAARRQLRTTVRLEVVLLVVLLGVTAVLVNTRPAAEDAGISGAFDTVVALTDDIDVNVVVDPNRAGANEIHAYVLDDTGRPLDAVEEVRFELTQVDEDIGPIERTPLPAGPGHWVLTGSELVVPGTWQVTTVVALDRFTEERVDVEVVVNPS
nr:CopD family protein [Salsipaludibacter albus]